MSYSTEYDDEGNVLKEIYVDEYGNVEMTYIDEKIKDVNTFSLFTNIICSYKLELSINRQLYEKGSISKELYEKVEKVLLERMKPLLSIIEVIAEYDCF